MKNKVLFWGIFVLIILVIVGISWLLITSNQKAEQIQRSNTCKDLCGDGTCQEVVCTGVDCPCPETPTSCSQDCFSEEEIRTEGTTEDETAEPTETEDETANWKTYKSEGYNFKVKYPNDWYYHVSDFKEVSRQMICFNPKETSEDFCIVILMVDWDTSLQEMYTTTKQTFEKLNTVTESVTSVDNVQAKVITTDTTTGISKTLFFEKDGRVYNFGMEAGNETIFNQMLSAFKFLE